MKPNIALFALIVALPTTILAQNQSASPIGLTANPTENIVLYSDPPKGVLSKSVPQAIISVGENNPMLFPLEKTANGQKYVVAQPGSDAGTTLIVQDYIDVVQGKQVNRWLELQSSTTGASAGWAFQGVLGASTDSMMFTLEDPS